MTKPRCLTKRMCGTVGRQRQTNSWAQTVSTAGCSLFVPLAHIFARSIVKVFAVSEEIYLAGCDAAAHTPGMAPCKSHVTAYQPALHIWEQVQLHVPRKTPNRLTLLLRDMCLAAQPLLVCLVQMAACQSSQLGITFSDARCHDDCGFAKFWCVTAKVLQDLHTRNLVDPTASMAVSSCRAPKSKLTSNLDGRLIFPF